MVDRQAVGVVGEGASVVGQKDSKRRCCRERPDRHIRCGPRAAAARKSELAVVWAAIQLVAPAEIVARPELDVGEARGRTRRDDEPPGRAAAGHRGRPWDQGREQDKSRTQKTEPK